MGADAASTRLDPALSGVPETMLWPLWNRACEARRPDSLIDDPWSIDLVEALDYDFEASFGEPSVFHAIRSRVCDDLIRRHEREAGDAARVISLGEGVDSTRLRTGFPVDRWTSVDLPEALALRAQLVPGAAEEARFPISALDHGWVKAQAPGPVFIAALGLLMYFTRDEVVGLLTAIASRLPGAELFFDTIPPFFSRRTLEGFAVTPTYEAPPMPWGISVAEVGAFCRSLGFEVLRVQTYADPYPRRTPMFKLLGLIPGLRRKLAGGLVHVRVAGSA
ncbi:MAG: class I SAM-dependent methyltransferase [Pseudomonadota bacterium]